MPACPSHQSAAAAAFNTAYWTRPDLAFCAPAKDRILTIDGFDVKASRMADVREELERVDFQIKGFLLGLHRQPTPSR